MFCKTNSPCTDTCLCPPSTHTCDKGTCKVGLHAPAISELLLVPPHSLLVCTCACGLSTPRASSAAAPNLAALTTCNSNASLLQASFEIQTPLMVPHRQYEAEVLANDQVRVGSGEGSQVRGRQAGVGD